MSRLLIVEDDLNELDLRCRRIAIQHSYAAIIQAKNATEAILHIQNDEPFDLVITDMHMPEEGRYSDVRGEEGLKVVEAARQKDIVTEIIVLTAYGDLDNVYQALECGANQYVDKNRNQAEEILLTMVHNRIEHIQQLRAAREILIRNPTISHTIRRIEAEALVRFLQERLRTNPPVVRKLIDARGLLQHIQDQLPGILDDPDRYERFQAWIGQLMLNVSSAIVTLKPITKALRDMD